MKVFCVSSTGDWSQLIEARPLLEEEMKDYPAEEAERILLVDGRIFPLPLMNKHSVPASWWTERFIWKVPGFGEAVSVSHQEWIELLKLGIKKMEEDAMRQRGLELKFYTEIVARAERQPEIPTADKAAELAKTWKDDREYKEFEGFMPDVICKENYEYAKQYLKEHKK